MRAKVLVSILLVLGLLVGCGDLNTKHTPINPEVNLLDPYTRSAPAARSAVPHQYKVKAPLNLFAARHNLTNSANY